MSMKHKLMLGDCLEVLRKIPDNFVSAVVTDPPYGLAFMGKKWDYDVPSVEVWKEIFRVLKPGGHLLAFGGTRTYHRMVVAIEDAGFEVRDQLQWLYGSGFPKSLDVSKAIDKAAGAERVVIGKHPQPAGNKAHATVFSDDNFEWKKELNITAPATEDAKQWSGWGTALKPANEPIVLCRKPLSEKTVAANVLKWGTGALNVDGCRIGISEGDDIYKKNPHTQNVSGPGFAQGGAGAGYTVPVGRFPANLLLDEEAARELDKQSLAGGMHSAGKARDKGSYSRSGMFDSAETGAGHRIGDKGGASRFFYVAKASRRERNHGLELVTPTTVDDGRQTPIDNPFLRGQTPRQNTHPTVKPIKLMRYLVRLITPPDKIVLDPFMGSGTTGIAALAEGCKFLGIEREPEYLEIARKRIEAPQTEATEATEDDGDEEKETA